MKKTKGNFYYLPVECRVISISKDLDFGGKIIAKIKVHTERGDCFCNISGGYFYEFMAEMQEKRSIINFISDSFLAIAKFSKDGCVRDLKNFYYDPDIEEEEEES